MKVDKETGEILDEDFEVMVEAIDVDTIEKLIEHPCEELFDIEPGTTAITVPAPRSTDLIELPHYDEKDNEIEEQFQEVYDKAMDAFDGTQGDMEGVEGKFRARNLEVAALMLNTALSAAKEKASLKIHKDKLTPGSTMGDNNVVNNTQINMSTSDLIKMLAENEDPTNNNIIPDTVIIEQDDKPRRNTIKRKKK